MKTILTLPTLALCLLPINTMAVEKYLIIAWPDPTWSSSGATIAGLNAETIEQVMDDKAQMRATEEFDDFIEPGEGITYYKESAANEKWYEAHPMKSNRIIPYASKTEINTKLTNWKNNLTFEIPDGTSGVTLVWGWANSLKEMEDAKNWVRWTE